MAVLRVEEDSRSSGSSRGQGGVTFRRRWNVVTDDAQTACYVAETAQDPSTGEKIPAVGTPLTFTSGGVPVVDNTRIVDNISTTPDDDNPMVVRVDVNYKNITGSGGTPPTDPTVNPLDAEPEISGSFTEQEVEQFLDINGDPIQNSAGEVFDPPVMETLVDPVVTITRNEAKTSLAAIIAKQRTYTNKVNADEWQGQPKNTVRIDMTYTAGFENNVEFWRVAYQMTMRDPDWKRRLIDHGFQKLVPSQPGGSADTIEEITDPNGNQRNSPVNLDGNGMELTVGNDPVILEFVTKEAVPFAPLGLTNL